MDNMMDLASFWENWEFFREASLSGVMAGLMLGVVGVYIVMKRLVFLSAALAQMSSAGIALGVWLLMIVQGSVVLHGDVHIHDGAIDAQHASLWWDFLFNPVLDAAILSILAIAIIGYGQRRSGRDMSSFVALLYIAGASTTLVVGTRIVTEIQDIQQLLLGNAVLVSPEDFKLMAVVSVSTLLVHLVCRRGFECSSLDADGARVGGIAVGAMQFVLMCTIAVSIAVTTKVLGALPVFAFSVLSALAARRLSYNVGSMLIVSALIGAICAFVGYIVAYIFAFPVGPSQALMCLLCVIVAYLIHYIVHMFLKLRQNNVMQASSI